jgi:hypothetical protein
VRTYLSPVGRVHLRKHAITSPVLGASASIMGSELQPPALRFAPLLYRRVVLMYTRATSLPSPYIRNIMPTDTSIPLLEYLALSGWG